MIHPTRHTALALALLLSSALAGCSSGATAPAPPPVAARSLTPSVEGVRSVRIPVQWRDAREVAGVLREVLGVPGPTGVRAVLADASTSSIVVVGTEAGIGKVRQLLSPALVGSNEDAGTEVVALEHADVRRLASALESVAPGDVRVVIDEPTNSLVIAGPPTSRERVVRLARELDAPGG